MRSNEGNAPMARSRSEIPFAWSASCGMPALATLAGVRYDRLFLDADSFIEAYRKGAPMAQELFGPDVQISGPGWAGISYGHINTLGSELKFPEDSEVAHTPIYDSLEAGIKALEADVDFAKSGMFPFYLNMWQKLQNAFPEERIPFSGFSAEGPVTTAWALRGHGFFMDILDRPAVAREYLQRVTASVVKYRKLIRSLNGDPEFTDKGAGVCDDIAAMVPPRLWPDLVLPYLEQYFAGQTSGMRTAHIEDLTADHLKYLDALGLSMYDPSVSAKLTPALIRDGCRTPFKWRLNSTHYRDRSAQDIERWVFESVADGASEVFTIVAREMCTAEAAEKVRAFIRAAKKVAGLLYKGCSRMELRDRYAAGQA